MGWCNKLNPYSKADKYGRNKKSEDLITKPCLNIHIGSWILARHFQICGVSWNCLGSYNAGFRKDRHETREQYANKIWRIYRDMKGICLPDRRQAMQTIVGISLSPVYILPLMFTFSIIGRTLLFRVRYFYLIQDISGIRHTLLFCQEYGYTV